MSTRGNYVFIDCPYNENDDGKWIIDDKQIDGLKKRISNETPLIKSGHKIYVHSDNYPDYALPNLFKFLNCDGAKERANDAAYLSAWFIAYHAANNLLPYNVKKPEEWSWKQRRKFYETYEPKSEDILNTDDFTGIGLENSITDWANYTYVILNDLYIEKNTYIRSHGFRIFVYGYNFDFISEIHSTDDLNELKQEEWWD